MTPEEINARRFLLAEQCSALPPAENRSAPIHVSRWGDSGPRVLFIHGGVQGAGAASSTFECQRMLADEGWRLEIADRPGFGESPSHGVDDQEADAHWITELVADGAHLVGHSWGAAGAFLATARHPEAVRSLTLIEPALFALLINAPEFDASPAAQTDLAKSTNLLFTSSTPADYALAFSRSLSGQHTNRPNPAVAALESSPEAAARVGCAFLRARAAPSTVAAAAAQAIAAADRPVLVVTGGWSPAFDAIGAVVARMTLGKHIVLEAPDHFVQLSAADAFNRELERFLGDSEKQ